jgi:hypothetical protein
MKSKNIFVKATTEPSQVYLIKEKNTLGLTSKNPESMEHYGSGTHNQHVYITNKESYAKGDWCIEIETEEVFKVEEVKEFSGIVRSATDTFVYDACVKIVLATDLKLVADGIKEINSDFLEWLVKNSSCDSVEVETYCPNDCNGCVEKCKNSFYKIIPKEEPNYNMKKEILAEMMSKDEELGIYQEPKKLKVMIVGDGMPTKESLEEKLDKIVSKESSKFWKESNDRFKNKEMPKQVKCYDKYNQLLKEGDYVDVQKDGVHQIYKKEDGELYFNPYGKQDRVSAYFSNDIAKCDAEGNWINNGCYEEIEESKAIEEPNYQQELFNYLHDELDVIALESQLQEIERIVGKMFSKNKYGEKDLETAWCSSEQNMRFTFSSSAYRSITFKKWLESFKNE